VDWVEIILDGDVWRWRRPGRRGSPSPRVGVPS
jgi:hypothetical protein